MVVTNYKERERDMFNREFMSIPVNEPASITIAANLTGLDLWLDLIQYRRPYDTKTDNLFADALAEYITTALGYDVTRDKVGNIFVRVGTNPSTAFTAHTDTVHNMGGVQTIGIDDTLLHAVVNDPISNCLGADDTTGIVILLELMRAGTDAVYCFFRGEEVGGVGSSEASTDLYNSNGGHPMNGVNKVVSFDRRGYSDVITHQGHGNCASDTFASSLAYQLNMSGLTYRADDSGIYTDSAEFMEDISECTNISVGYDNEHTRDEFQDLGFLFDYLIPAVLEVNWGSLPCLRDPKDYMSNAWGGWGNDYPEYKPTKVSNTATGGKDYANVDPAIANIMDLAMDNIKCGELVAFLELHSIEPSAFVAYCYANGIV